MNRARLFVALLGFLLAIGGIALDNRELIWAAMALLVASLALRLYLRKRDN